MGLGGGALERGTVLQMSKEGAGEDVCRHEEHFLPISAAHISVASRILPPLLLAMHCHLR